MRGVGHRGLLAGRRLPETRQRLMAVADRQESGEAPHRSAGFGALQYKCLRAAGGNRRVSGRLFQ